MKLKRSFFIEFIILLTAFLLINPGFSQMKKQDMISFTGVIENISEDSKFVVVNEVKIFISSSGTRINDEKGNILKISDLKPKLHVGIEALRSPNGIVAKKIVIKTSKRNR